MSFNVFSKDISKHLKAVGYNSQRESYTQGTPVVVKTE